MSTPGFRLSYFVHLRDNASPDGFIRDLNVSFLSLAELGRQATSPSPPYSCPDVNVSYNHSARCHVVEVLLAAEVLGLDSGGLARLLTSLLGNQFRHESIEWVSLDAVEPLSGLDKCIQGPAFGAASLLELADGGVGPVFSVPLPRGLCLEEETSIASALVTSGVTLLTQSPFTTTPPDALPKITTEMEAIGESTGRRFVYFVNATSKLQYVQAYVRALSKLVSHYVTFGLRVCPLSMGLNVCAWIRSRIPHPIYGYNLLPLGHRIDPSYELTPRSLATLLRLAGVDALNVGLKYQSIASGTAVPDYLRACRDPLPDDILPSLPMLTGGITPRVACRIVAAHGSKLGLHIKKPILRSGLHITKIKRNMKAFDQAVAIALSGRDIDEVVGAEARGTKALRSYERDFGQ